MRGIRSIESQLAFSQEKCAKLLKDEKQLDALPTDKKLAALFYENNIVREELKRLDKLVAQMVEYHGKSKALFNVNNKEYD